MGVRGVPYRPDAAEIERMMDEHGNALLRLCFLYLRDEAGAEDAVQETFLKAYLNYGAFRGESGERTWLTRIAINACKDMLRKSSRRRELALDAAEALPARAQAPEDADVLRAVMELPEKYRLPVLLRYWQGMDVGEVAGALGISPAAVSTRLTRARTRLRDRLKGWDADEE